MALGLAFLTAQNQPISDSALEYFSDIITPFDDYLVCRVSNSDVLFIFDDYTYGSPIALQNVDMYYYNSTGIVTHSYDSDIFVSISALSSSPNYYSSIDLGNGYRSRHLSSSISADLSSYLLGALLLFVIFYNVILKLIHHCIDSIFRRRKARDL